MSYFNNFYATDDKKNKYYENRGIDQTDQNTMDIYNKAFSAADQGGQDFLGNFDFNNGSGINWNDFSSGMSKARQKGWDDWWSDTNNFGDFQGYNANENSNLFSDGAFSWSGAADPWDAMLANNPNFEAYQNIVNNTQTTRKATDADVAAGLASVVGEDITEFNMPSVFDTAKGKYYENFQDIVDMNKLKEVSSMDLLQQLKGLANTSTNSLNDSIDLFKLGQESNITTSEAARDTDIDTLMNSLKGTASIYGVDVQTLIDNFFTKQKTTDDAFTTALDKGITDYENSKETALSDLYDSRSDNVLSKYKGITDALRGDNMLAKRSGEFGTSGSTNKMLIDAAMRAASDKQGVLGDLYEQRAQEQFNIDNEIASLSKSVDDLSADLAKGRADAKAFEIKELGNFTADQKFEIESNRAKAKKGVDDWRSSESFGLYSSLSTQRKELRDRLAEMEKSFSIAHQNRLKAMRDEFAIAVGTTPDMTDPIQQLVNEYIALEAAKGKVNIQNAEEYYEANKDVLQQIVDNPNSFMQMLGMQVADDLKAMGFEDEMLRSQLTDKMNNIGDITGIIEGLADFESNDELRGMVDTLNQLTSAMQGAQGTLGTNPTQQPNYTVPETDLTALNTLLTDSGLNAGDELTNKIVDWALEQGEKAWNSVFEDEEVNDDDGTPD